MVIITHEEGSRSLPEDVLTEILVRLPVKSLSQFKCVSKPWHGFIESSYFVNRHIMHKLRNEILCVKRYIDNDLCLSLHDPNSQELSMISGNMSIMPYLQDQQYFCPNDACELLLLGACNGIVCLALYDVFILCNPILGELKRLPPRPWAHDSSTDYCDYQMGSGFGYDHLSASYKVVFIYHVDHVAESHFDGIFHPTMVDVYDSMNNSWRIIDTTDNDYSVLPNEYSTLGNDLSFNGFCHWDVYCQGPLSYMLSFDTSNEKFGRIEYPDVWQEDESMGRKLVILHDCLAIVRHKDYMNEPYRMEIWVMKEYGAMESWTMDYVIGSRGFRHPFFCLESECILMEDNEGRLASIALCSDEIRTFPFTGYKNSWGAILLKGSLISLRDVIDGES